MIRSVSCGPASCALQIGNGAAKPPSSTGMISALAVVATQQQAPRMLG